MKRYKQTGYGVMTLRRRLQGQVDELELMAQDGRLDPTKAHRTRAHLLAAINVLYETPSQT